MNLLEFTMLPAATGLYVACSVGLLMSLPFVIAQATLINVRNEMTADLVTRIHTAFDVAFDTDTETLEAAA